MDHDKTRRAMQKAFKPIAGPTPNVGRSASRTSCRRCFLMEMAAAGKCFCNYQPEIAERPPVIVEILSRPTETWSDRDVRLVRLESERLQEAIEVMEEFQSWREKMDSMMEQASQAAKAGGVFYHPCTGCPEWEW